MAVFVKLDNSLDTRAICPRLSLCPGVYNRQHSRRGGALGMAQNFMLPKRLLPHPTYR